LFGVPEDRCLGCRSLGYRSKDFNVWERYVKLSGQDLISFAEVQGLELTLPVI
jgi:hypothetical protein